MPGRAEGGVRHTRKIAKAIFQPPLFPSHHLQARYVSLNEPASFLVSAFRSSL
jgi:hypothetical protein